MLYGRHWLFHFEGTCDSFAQTLQICLPSTFLWHTLGSVLRVSIHPHCMRYNHLSLLVHTRIYRYTLYCLESSPRLGNMLCKSLNTEQLLQSRMSQAGNACTAVQSSALSTSRQSRCLVDMNGRCHMEIGRTLKCIHIHLHPCCSFQATHTASMSQQPWYVCKISVDIVDTKILQCLVSLTSRRTYRSGMPCNPRSST